jgi:nitroreductase
MSKAQQLTEGNFPTDGAPEERLHTLVRHAILAPSSHNSQPWKFAVHADGVDVFRDTARWLKVADRDQRELHISVGCALENLIVAAERFGYRPKLSWFPDPEEPDLIAAVHLALSEEARPSRDPGLFEAIPLRHTNHGMYEERAIPEGDLQRLRGCIQEGALHLYLTDDTTIKRQVDDLMVQADARQFADPEWREELGYWIGQGAFGTNWLMSKMGQLAVTFLNMGEGTAKKDSRVLMSAPTLGAIASDEDSRRAQVQVGQALERVWLTATQLGISLHPMNQILQLPETKSQVAQLIPEVGLFPQLTFRLGYAGPEQGRTPRRPVDEVLK